MVSNSYNDMYKRVRWGEIRAQILVFILSFMVMSIYFITDNYSIQYPTEYINELVTARFGGGGSSSIGSSSSGFSPLKDVHCLVTGATSGLGKEISSGNSLNH